MSCAICEGNITDNNGEYIFLEDGEKIGICPNCFEDVYIDGYRRNTDIMIVPVSEKTFLIACKYHKYYRPSQSFRQSSKFIAFYRSSDNGGITHISYIIRIERNVTRQEIKDLYAGDKEMKWRDNDIFAVFTLGDIKKLKTPIKRKGAAPIQNRIYKSFRVFSRAKTHQDLYR